MSFLLKTIFITCALFKEPVVDDETKFTIIGVALGLVMAITVALVWGAFLTADYLHELCIVQGACGG